MAVIDVGAKVLGQANEPAIATQTEQANYNFYLQARQIEGIQVSIHGGDTWSEITIVVVVPDLLDTIADKVFDLKTHIHQLYPSARLDVCITEAKATTFQDELPSTSTHV